MPLCSLVNIVLSSGKIMPLCSLVNIALSSGIRLLPFVLWLYYFLMGRVYPDDVPCYSSLCNLVSSSLSLWSSIHQSFYICLPWYRIVFTFWDQLVLFWFQVKKHIGKMCDLEIKSYVPFDSQIIWLWLASHFRLKKNVSITRANERHVKPIPRHYFPLCITSLCFEDHLVMILIWFWINRVGESHAEPI